MDLNKDCVRDVLLTLEKHLSLDDKFRFKEIYINDFVNYKELSKYDKKTIAYTVYMIADAKLIIAGNLHEAVRITAYSIRTITYSGHKFIDTIRDNKVWSQTKKIANSIGSASIEILSNIAVGVINTQIELLKQGNAQG